MPTRICAILLLQLSMVAVIGLVFRVATCLPADRTPQDSSRTASSDLQTPLVGPRMSLAIVSIEGETAAAPLVQLADDYLMGALLERRRFQLIEREKMKQVLKEQKLAKERLTAPEQSIRLGRLMAADVLLAATIRMTPSSMEATCRVIVTESSETFEVRVSVGGTERVSLKELTKSLAARVSHLFPLAGGAVTGHGNQLITTDIGSATGIRTGTDCENRSLELEQVRVRLVNGVSGTG